MQLMGIAALNPSCELRVWRAVLCHGPETVIASAAKQSILSLRGKMDCFAALAMTATAMDLLRGRDEIEAP